ncbi:TPA: diphthine synthase [Candidatus Micrarchaeota archaeon]|nr:diphthine synthase [Candidatus Micrarchaeota archaeon]
MENGKLYLVGLGISDEKGTSLQGLQKLKECWKIYAESSANLLPEGTLARLEKLVGKPIEILSREQVEGEKEILQSASSAPTALVVSGDPMIATTHISLVLAAKKKGIQTEIIHASSILSAAIGESGLQAYKFGKTTTLAYWRENYKPMAAYDTIAENLSRGLHTLLLLDIDEKLGPMPPSEAARILLEMEKQGKKGMLTLETKVVLLQGVSYGGEQRKVFAPLLAFSQMSAMRPCVLILPGALHFLEEEFLQSL